MTIATSHLAPRAVPTRDRTARAADALLVALCPLVIAFHPLANNDLPMHLAIGEWILDHRTLPARDPFSFNGADVPWVPHEWLAALVFTGVEQLAGVTGLVLLCAAFSVGLAAAHRAVASRLSVDTTAHLAYAVPLWLMAGGRLMLRPHLPALALAFLLWWLLLRGRDHPRQLWLVPPVMVVWVNLHGSFPLGFGILALDLLLPAGGHSASWRTRAAVAGAAGAALLTQVHAYFQPSLLAGVRDALGLLGDPVFMGEVNEWRPPFTTPRFRGTYGFAISLPWIALAARGLLRRDPLVPLSYRIFVVASFVLYVRHQRFLALFALAALPLLPRPGHLPAPGSWRWLLPRLCVVAAASLFVLPGFPERVGGQPRAPGFRWGHDLPFAAVEFLASSGYRGRILCEYKFGGVVAWRGEGRLQPSMDSRNSVYGADRFLAHQRALREDGPQREALLEQVGAALILRSTPRVDRRDLIDRLQRDPRWRLVHSAPRSLLYLKRSPTRGGRPRASNWVRGGDGADVERRRGSPADRRRVRMQRTPDSGH